MPPFLAYCLLTMFEHERGHARTQMLRETAAQAKGDCSAPPREYPEKSLGLLLSCTCAPGRGLGWYKGEGSQSETLMVKRETRLKRLRTGRKELESRDAILLLPHQECERQRDRKTRQAAKNIPLTML